MWDAEAERGPLQVSGGSEVLRGVDLSVDRGEGVAVVGPNGSGKTALLMIAAGLLEPLRGTVLLDGEALKDQLPQARRRIGLVFQDPDDQIFNPTVHDEIAYAPRQILSPEEAEERA
ncbi:ABC transporter ATP-binding protein [Candidatus Bathyarchaeota archaeon]|nr:ABC transporter ATP-binding protein [Candidatus Bathyarchaeota archaeon]